MHNGTFHFTDKLLGNFAFIGFIFSCFPNAKVIDIRREPVATCFGCYKQIFASHINFAYDLSDLKSYYDLYESMMDYWEEVFPGKVLRVQYERLVSDPEQSLRNVLSYCGLEWDENCLNYTENPNVVSSASVLQVRQSLNTNQNKAWTYYRKHLDHLIDHFDEPPPGSLNRIS